MKISRNNYNLEGTDNDLCLGDENSHMDFEILTNKYTNANASFKLLTVDPVDKMVVGNELSQKCD